MMKDLEQYKINGKLEVICGSMFSGKTEELMRRLKRAEYAKLGVLTIKHDIDKRYNKAPSCIVSHEGKERFAFTINNESDSFEKIIQMANTDIDIIGIDEGHFFKNAMVDVIRQLIFFGKRIIVAGLELDFRGEPFGIMPALLALADEVTKLKAVCVQCGRDAHHTQRIVNGVPADYNDPIILVGASEFYEARCRGCFLINNSLKIDQSSSLDMFQNLSGHIAVTR